MGLNETRKMKKFRETFLPSRVKEIEEICGAPIPHDVDWQSLASDLEGLNFLDNISCHRVNMALRMICQDEMKMMIEGGVFEMHCVYALRSDGMFSDSAIHALMTERL